MTRKCKATPKKRMFRDEERTWAAIEEEINRDGEHLRDKLEPYSCRFCGMWHITSVYKEKSLKRYFPPGNQNKFRT
jgi:hypothetical protein